MPGFRHRRQCSVPSPQNLKRRHQLSNKSGFGTKNFNKRTAYANLDHQVVHQQIQWGSFVNDSYVVLGRVFVEQVWKPKLYKQKFDEFWGSNLDLSILIKFSVSLSVCHSVCHSFILSVCNTLETLFLKLFAKFFFIF